jgi:hypothetical protein
MNSVLVQVEGNSWVRKIDFPRVKLKKLDYSGMPQEFVRGKSQFGHSRPTLRSSL